MGNQNTSGIVDEKGANESVGKAQEVSSGHDLKEDNAVLTQEHETQDSQDKTDRSDSHDVGADVSPPVGTPANGEKEEANGYLNEEREPHTSSALPEILSNGVEMEEPNSEGGKSMLVDQVHDQLPCNLEEEIQRSGSILEPKSMSPVEDLNSLPHEAIYIASEPQEDQTMFEEETAGTLGSVKAYPIEAESGLSDTKAVQDLGVNAVLSIDDNDAEKNENNLVVSDTDSANGALSETCTHKTELPIVMPADDSSLLDMSAARNECLADVEEKLTVNELGNGDNTSPVDESQPPGAEINQPLSCSHAQPETIESGVKKDENAVETSSFSASAEEETDQIGFSNSLKLVQSEEPKDTNEDLNDVGLVQTEGLISIDDKLTDESALIQTSPSTDQHSNSRAPTSDNTECKEHQETSESIGVDSNPSVQVELRKSPSFEFGLAFHTKSEESDQTPLLYQDRAATRSFSNGSALRFKSRSVQTEHLGKSLQYEAIDAEEKTITMERSHSESSRTHSLNLPNKNAKSDTMIKAKQENSASSDENSLKDSASSEDRAIVSPKENGKRRPRPSLFTTCLCCTAAIS
ncbi:hypothetical protein Salat_0568600 [Sesamum alatum]|uniref:Uncharacterized protein n=1 Tax=Sesamum alatum TaxID=300844 RepID=A0AAE2CTY6_9LAMI|nr:hypothetical protein Salat_0568600 [Sesamum alatum]